MERSDILLVAGQPVQGFGDNNLCGYQVGPNGHAHTPLLLQLASKTGNARMWRQ